MDVPKPRRLTVCRSCQPYAAAHTAARHALRLARATVFRAAMAAERPFLQAPLEEETDCAACGLSFTKLPGSLRHHCRACGCSLCAACLCGAANCLVNAARCPHYARWERANLGLEVLARLYGKDERVCRGPKQI